MQKKVVFSLLVIVALLLAGLISAGVEARHIYEDGAVWVNRCPSGAGRPAKSVA